MGLFRLAISIDGEKHEVDVNGVDLVRLEEQDPSFGEKCAAARAADEVDPYGLLSPQTLIHVAWIALGRASRKELADVVVPDTLEGFLDSLDDVPTVL